MSLSPLDVAQQKFSRSWHGLDAREVEAFLASVAHSMTALVQRNAELTAELAAQSQRAQVLQSRENDVKEVLMTARRTGEQVCAQAEREAKLRLEAADIKGQQIVAEAHERAVFLAAQVKDLMRQRARFLEELRGLIATHGRLLELHVADAPELENKARPQGRSAGGDVLEMLQPPTPPALDEVVAPRRHAGRPSRSLAAPTHAANE